MNEMIMLKGFKMGLLHNFGGLILKLAIINKI